MTPHLPLPAGFVAAPVTVEDAAAIAEVINADMAADLGRPWTTTEETRDQLATPGIDLANDHALVRSPDGSPASYLWLSLAGEPVEEIRSLVFTSPRFHGLGLSAALLRHGERRAEAIVRATEAEGPVALLVARLATNARAEALFRSLGYRIARTFHMMSIDLDAAPPMPQVPAGLEIRTFDGDKDARPVFDAMIEAFEDHWGSESLSFEQWRHLEIDGEGARHDPGLWFVAVDGDEVAGVALCASSSPRDADTAVVEELAVRRPWRRRGVGLALLRSAFGAFVERGIPRAELGVDSESPTGATRLYERAGMAPVYGWEWWSKPVVP